MHIAHASTQTLCRLQRVNTECLHWENILLYVMGKNFPSQNPQCNVLIMRTRRKQKLLQDWVAVLSSISKSFRQVWHILAIALYPCMLTYLTLCLVHLTTNCRNIHLSCGSHILQIIHLIGFTPGMCILCGPGKCSAGFSVSWIWIVLNRPLNTSSVN